MSDVAQQIDEALSELERALKVLKRRPKRGAPASAEALAELEASWGRSLPPSYRAFLRHTDGFADRATDPTVIGLFGTRTLTSRAGVMREAAEWKKADPDCAEAVRGLVIGRTLDGWTLLDPGATAGDELSVVTVDSEYEIVQSASVVDYLKACATSALEQKKSSDWAKESARRAKELSEMGAQWELVEVASVSPDGRRVAVLSVGAVHLFDAEKTTTIDGAPHAPWLWVASGTATPWNAPRRDTLAFTEDGSAVVRVTHESTFVFDVATGAPRKSEGALAAPKDMPWRPSTRFRRRDGIKLARRAGT
ncbi:MAG: SMI1/KNR4 family protein [Labilithrix sp.]|nr:SMI1/KNR4 family protein [Labilithrix sp.]